MLKRARIIDPDKHLAVPVVKKISISLWALLRMDGEVYA